MKTDETMKRLRAARPAAVEPGEHGALFAQIVAKPGDSDLESAAHARPRVLIVKRPRVLAGGSLGIAGIAAAAVLAFSGSAAAPAFAVTREADGTVLVTLRTPDAIVAADEQLVKMGIKEQVNYQMEPGAATSSAPVACRLVLGPGDYSAAPQSAGPPVQMLLGSDNTGVTPAGNSGPGGNTGATEHLASCVSYPEGPGTQLGNSGQKFLDANGG